MSVSGRDPGVAEQCLTAADVWAGVHRVGGGDMADEAFVTGGVADGAGDEDGHLVAGDGPVRRRPLRVVGAAYPRALACSSSS